MSLMKLAFKNATVKWWRSLTLGFFIFAVCFVMVLSSSFITAARDKVGKAILDGFTGDIQLRSEGTTEGDMVTQYSQGWDAIKPLDNGTLASVRQIVGSSFPGVRSYLLTRRSAFLERADKREQTMLVGIEPGFSSYKNSFLLTKGRYLEPGGKDEILLTEEQAAGFGADVGDTIKVAAKNIFGLNTSKDLKVVGIGNYIMLSLFSYKADYTSQDVVAELAGMDRGGATDLILFTPEGRETGEIVKGLSGALGAQGIKYTVTQGEKIKSEDMEVKELDLSKLEERDKGVLISTFGEMGNSFKGISDTMFIMLNLLVLFVVIIVSILIVNLVYMAGLERYREIGTLRALGFSRPQVVGIFMGEMMLVSVLSGMLGILVSSGLISVIGSLGLESPIPAMDFIMGGTLSLKLDITSIGAILLIIVCFSFGASFYPAWRACSVDPAETMRTV